MEIMEFVLLAVPVVFLVGSILLAYKAVKSGAKRKTAVFTQIASFRSEEHTSELQSRI